jgi:DNA-binding CsgD family transcriptional regulator
MTAPLQIIALSFSRDTDSAGRILAEVDRLRGRGVLRLLDMLFVAKSQEGTIEQLSIGDDEDFGSLLTAVLPLSGENLAAAAPAGGSVAFDTGDAWALAQSLQPGTALAFLLVEHRWAEPLFDAISQSGGTLTAEGFLTSEAQLVIGAEVAAMEESAQVIAQAQAAETDALLIAMAAESRATEAVVASERIQSAAAAGAVRALIAAGLVEEAAAHEAVAALAAAGLMEAAADEATAAAIADIAAADEATSAAVAQDADAIADADEMADAAVAGDAAAVAAADEAAADAIAEDTAAVDDVDEVSSAAIADDLASVAAADEASGEAQGRAKAAAITKAEAQVLRYLPEPIPFSVIADKLGISRSAAKERAERLYKRLGVHSRDEAVSRARFLGLIPSTR